MTLNWPAISQAAKRANAAYQTKAADSKAAFSSLGDTWVDLYTTDSIQAALSVDAAGTTHLSISGTRASDGYVLDVFRDISLKSVPVKGGSVTEGVLADMNEMWAWALKTAPTGAVFNVAGHSLGASRTHLTPLFLPPAQIGALHSFEAPKFADVQFYRTYARELAGMVCVLNGRDSWAAWPWIDLRWQSRPQQDHVWLKESGFEVIPTSQWPGAGDFSDHDIDLVQSRCEAIAASMSNLPSGTGA
jgi:hypothetical protein